MGGACSRERAVQAEVWELARTARWLPPYKQPSTSPRGCCVALQGWSIGCVGWLPREPAGGERPPRTLGLDLSLPFRHACCMPGAMRDWILPPREGGPIRLSCWTVYIACHGETASPGAGRAAYPTLLEVSFICLLVLL